MFEVGERVVCVNNERLPDQDPSLRPPRFLKKGAVYTIVGFGIIPSWHLESGNAVLYLKEIKNHVRGEDIGFSVKRFRKLPKTSIEIFHKIRLNVEKKTKVDA